MTTQNTLLAHIVPMYGKTELVAIEALKYILEQSEAARTALESMLYAGGVGVGSLMRFQTEALGDESERVDLVCYDASGDELGPAFARRMLQLPQLIDDATDRARSAGWVSTERLSRTPWATGYGRYMQLAGVYSRFDVNFYYWANLGDTPLWLNPYNLNGLDEDEVLRRLRMLEDKGAILGDDWYIPISIPTGVEYDAVLEAVVDQLERIGRLIEPSGPTYQD